MKFEYKFKKFLNEHIFKNYLKAESDLSFKLRNQISKNQEFIVLSDVNIVFTDTASIDLLSLKNNILVPNNNVYYNSEANEINLSVLFFFKIPPRA